jgi:hypothetical protein
MALAWKVGVSLDRAVERAWSLGWQPADLFRCARRELKRPAQAIVGDSIASQARSYQGDPSRSDPSWLGQLDDAGVRIWWDPQQPWLTQWVKREQQPWPKVLRSVVEVLVVLACLPRLPRLGPPPDEWTRSPIQHESANPASKVLTRVRSLLAKAESTPYPHEAEALSAKAQELMTRYSIDEAVVDAAKGEGGARPGGRRLGVDDPYAGGKAQLLTAIADANSCRSVWSPNMGFSTVFGYPLDLDATELLYTSLLVQANAAMVAAGSQRDRSGKSRTRSFRASFMEGFAWRTGQRLRAASKAATEAASAERGTNVLPVLAARTERVDAARDAAFPDLTSRSGSITNAAGWRAGVVAAELASHDVRSAINEATA